MSDTVQQIKDKLDILEVISPYVELHKAGKNYKGKSPFTAEKTPSFFVSPDRGMYYCFSTSQGGDMFTFIEKMEGVEFKEALKILADKAGVELVPEAPEKKTARDRSFSALAAAATFYSEQLETNAKAQTYLEQRGVNEFTRKKWQIGYAPGPPKDGWREVKEALERQGYTKDELQRVGLIKTTEGGKEPYDVFRDRIMFPMRNSGGKVVAFSGRILSKDSEAPKYVNSPETELYKKSELLYGYDMAKTGIRNLDFSLIVEGQFDVVMCHQAGYNNAVAVSGTALTPEHVRQLERLSDRVVLALDADKAGIAAMKRGADVMLRRGIDVKVAELPLGKDPADLIQANPADFKKVVGKSVHVIEFLLHVLKEQYPDERTLKLKTRTEILPFVLLLPNRIDQDHFVSVIAKAIGASKDAIRFEIDRLREESRVESRADDKPSESMQATRQSSMFEKRYLYLEAVKAVRPDLKPKIDAAEAVFAQYVSYPAIDASEVARVTFELSESFDHRKDHDVLAEVAGEMNRFHEEAAKKLLAQIRTEHEDWTSDEEATALHQKAEAMRREQPYTAEKLQ
jgi:DNA primase